MSGASENEVFQHFRILRCADGSLWKLGEGGMGATYKAIDSNLGVAVALKLIRADLLNRDPNARTRFIREAKAAASLRHRHVATVYHLGDDGQNYFYAMEFVDGETLEDRVKRLGPLPAAKVLTLALQASRALIAAHKVGLVHRDLKPANLMLVDEADEDDVLKVIDFGLAKSAAAGGDSGADYKITQTGFSAGFSPGYASPEQCQYLDADIRSDIYSLGVTLWFLFSGELPFAPTTGKPREAQVFELQNKHVHAPPPLEKLAAAGLPAPVCELLARMLAKDPDQRPQTPADLRREIEACQRTLSEEATIPVPPPPPAPYSFNLEDLLRQRGSFTWVELAPLLIPLATVADDLAASGILALACFTPCYVRAVFPSVRAPILSVARTRPPGPDFLRPAEWPHSWPDFILIACSSINTSAQERGPISALTQPHQAEPQFRDAPQALATLLYELLDGKPPFAFTRGGATYKPLPALSEAGNELLSRALLGQSERGFASARAYAAALEKTVNRPSFGADMQMDRSQSQPARTPGSLFAAPAPSDPQQSPTIRPQDRSTPFLVVILLLGLLLLGVGGVAGVLGWRVWHAPAPPSANTISLSAPPLPSVVPEPMMSPTPLPQPTSRPSDTVTTLSPAAPTIAPPAPISSPPSILAPSPFYPSGTTIRQPRPRQPWQNGLGMQFVPVADCRVLFSIWETRVGDFEAFATATGFDPGSSMVTLAADGWKQRGGNWRNPGFSQTALHPVVGVNWDTANAFCAWLTQHEKAAGRLPPTAVYRLPTDLEWSDAVGLPQERGGTPQQRKGSVPGVYPWGRQWPPPRGAGNFRGEESRTGQEPSRWDMIPGYRDGFPRTSPVGSFAPNRFGIYDLSGNVWEWCADLFRPGKSERVLRGGSWRNNTQESLLSSEREDGPTDSQDPIVGFRCVLDDTTW